MSGLAKQYVVRLTLLAALSMLSIEVRAQDPGPTEGYNNVSSDKNGTSAASGGYIDAGPFYASNSTDICLTINAIVTSSNYKNSFPNGAVIDARGILVNASGGLPLSCSVNPFQNVTWPSTILLPAVPIAIQAMWQLPSNTRIIGEGPASVTQLQIVDSSIATFSGSAMIEMCPGSSACTGITVEHLRLVAQDDHNPNNNYAVDGIDNNRAGDGSYVNDIVLANMGATSSTGTVTSLCSSTGPVVGLCISKNATYSGPYTNINFGASGACSGGACPPTACVKIQAQTRGLHGITCSATSNRTAWPSAAIYLDSYNTTIEDVHVEGFYDAVVVGDNADGEGGTVSGDTVANVTSAFGNGPVQNTVHICKQNTSNGACSSSSLAVSDLTILNSLSNGRSGNTPAPDTIQDDELGQTINSSTSLAYVGLYVLGDAVGSIGYSRFTTSGGPNSNNGNAAVTPTWGVGSSALGTSAPCTNSGAIFSNTGTAGTKQTIYVCSGGVWVGIG